MTQTGPTARAAITRVDGQGRVRAEDVLVVEEPLEIRLEIPAMEGVVTRSLAVTMRTPGNDFELAAGFLFTEGIVAQRDDIEQLKYCVDGPAEQEFNIVTVSLRGGVSIDPARLTRHFYTTSSCGVCGKASLDAVRVISRDPPVPGRPILSPDLVTALPERLREAQGVFARTGGLHAAGLFTADGRLVTEMEDVGRHNAVDKVIGEQFLRGATPLRDHVLQVSGRGGFEIVQKAAVAGIPIVSAVGAPSSLAVELAREFRMTLLGFVRDGRFNVYSDAGRIIAPG